MEEETWIDSLVICPECKCCEMIWEQCQSCGGDGVLGSEELMEEDPLWYDEDSFEVCVTCLGKGGWNICIGNCENGIHKNPMVQLP